MRVHKIMQNTSKQRMYAVASDKQHYKITKINKIKIAL